MKDYEDNDDLSSRKTKYSDLLAEINELDSITFEKPSIESTSSDPSNENSSSKSEDFFPSSLMKEKKKKKKDESYTDKDADEWFDDMVASSNILFNKNSKSVFDDIFDEGGINGKKKKKKKEKKKKEEVDYKKEFETEGALYKNLLREQTSFVDSLQKEYDHIKSTKSQSRGVTKQMTDLIDNINSARSLSMQLIDKTVALKKTIADLTAKQKKEANALLGEDGNLSDFGSTYLKNMIAERQNIINNGTGDGTISEYTDDTMFDEISNILDNDEDMQRPEEVEKYLKYENRDVSIYAYINRENTDDYDFIAKDRDGIEIDDYPLPIKTTLSINNSTNIATDTYGKKYNIIWR